MKVFAAVFTLMTSITISSFGNAETCKSTPLLSRDDQYFSYLTKTRAPRSLTIRYTPMFDRVYFLGNVVSRRWPYLVLVNHHPKSSTYAIVDGKKYSATPIGEDIESTIGYRRDGSYRVFIVKLDLQPGIYDLELFAELDGVTVASTLGSGFAWLPSEDVECLERRIEQMDSIKVDGLLTSVELRRHGFKSAAWLELVNWLGENPNDLAAYALLPMTSTPAVVVAQDASESWRRVCSENPSRTGEHALCPWRETRSIK